MIYKELNREEGKELLEWVEADLFLGCDVNHQTGDIIGFFVDSTTTGDTIIYLPVTQPLKG